jgi:hypothetical protein
MSATPQLRLWALCSGPDSRLPGDYAPPWAAAAEDIAAQLDAATREPRAMAALERAVALDYNGCMDALRAGVPAVYRVAFQIRGLVSAAADSAPPAKKAPAPPAPARGGLPLVYDTL